MNIKKTQLVVISFLTAITFLSIISCKTHTFDNFNLSSIRHNSTRHIIFTADDFGASENINNGIIKGIEAGIINSVAAMVTFPNAIEDILILRNNFEHIEIGLHLSITSGSPISNNQEVSTLLNKKGNFFTIDQFILNIEDINLKELEIELRNQIEILLDQGIKIASLSSQHNILGIYTPFFEIVLKLASEYNIPMRSTIPVSIGLKEFDQSMTRQRGQTLAKQLIQHNFITAIKFYKYSRLKEMQKNQLKMDKIGIAHPDYLIDAFWGTPTPGNLLNILQNLPEGKSELVFHLGVNDKKYDVPSGIEGEYFLMRELELYCLLSPELKVWLDKLNIKSINFSEL